MIDDIVEITLKSILGFQSFILILCYIYFLIYIVE